MKLSIERTLLLTQLSVRFPIINLSTLPIISTELEIFLQNSLFKSIITHSQEIFDLSPTGDSVFLIDNNSNYFSLHITKDINDPTCLILSLNVRDSLRRYKMETHVFLLPASYGQYQAVSVIVPQKLKVAKKKLEALVSVNFTTGYTWFYEQVLELVKREENELSSRLYQFAKSVVYTEELRSNLWFACITEGVGFRILGEAATKRAFDLIKDNAGKFKISANIFTAELLTTKLPEEQLLMINAIKEKKAISVNLKNALYEKSDSLYAATLKTLYGNDKFMVYPLYESSHLCVVALYSIKHAKELDFILDYHKIEFETLCYNSIGPIKSFVEKIDKRPKTILSRIWEAMEFKFEMFGIGLDVKKVLDEYRKDLCKQ